MLKVSSKHNASFVIFEGSNGEFTLSLMGVNDVFDITPKKIYNVGTAAIRVNNSSGLDYEQRQLFGFKVIICVEKIQHTLYYYIIFQRFQKCSNLLI